MRYAHSQLLHTGGILQMEGQRLKVTQVTFPALYDYLPSDLDYLKSSGGFILDQQENGIFRALVSSKSF